MASIGEWPMPCNRPHVERIIPVGAYCNHCFCSDAVASRSFYAPGWWKEPHLKCCQCPTIRAARFVKDDSAVTE